MSGEISLAGKRILYIAPRFFGYDQDIAAEMQRRGAHVVRLMDRPFDTPAMTALTKLAPGIIASAALPIYRKILSEDSFDIIFVVNGQTVSSTFLTELRQYHPDAKFILYLWDSLKNRASIVPNLDRYDYISGFDRFDARANGFQYRALFFTPAFEMPEEATPSYDISFIGTAHTDRAPIVREIDLALPPHIRRFWYLYLQATWVRRYYSAKSGRFRRVPAHCFSYESMQKAQIGQIFHQSRAILDIEHPLQRGMTMRVLETLGAGKKLITTNRHIAEEDFYDPRNIMIIDRNNVNIDIDFFDQPYFRPPDNIVDRYSIAGWMEEILRCAGVF